MAFSSGYRIKAAMGLGSDPSSLAVKCTVQCWGAWEWGLEYREEVEVEVNGNTETKLVSRSGEGEEK